MKTKMTILVLSIGIIISSCHKYTIAGFWLDYNNKNITDKISDQGPRGGYRAIHWKFSNPNELNTNSTLQFASLNGWKLVDSIKYSTDSIIKLSINDGYVFSSPKNLSDSIIKTFFKEPIWIKSDLTLYRFKTAWELMQPGDDTKSTEINGFIIVSHDNTEMCIYHYWGE